MFPYLVRQTGITILLFMVYFFINTKQSDLWAAATLLLLIHFFGKILAKIL